MGRSNQKDKLNNLLNAQKATREGIQAAAEKLRKEREAKEAEQREQSNQTETPDQS